MGKNQNINSNQPLCDKSGQQVAQSNLASKLDILQNNTDDLKENRDESVFQRRPQFRLSENIRRY